MVAAMDFQALDARLKANREAVIALLFRWLPNGKLMGDEFCIGSTKGEAGESMKFNVVTTIYKDFNAGDGGVGLISFYALLNTMTMTEAYRALGGDLASKSVGPVATPYVAKFEPATPPEIPPDEAPRADECFKHPQWGMPSVIHRYNTRDDALWFVCARYHLANGKKQFCPWVWKGGGWRPEAPAKPRPLYGLERLDTFPDAGCLVVEGEKAAEALQGVSPHQPILTWWGGAINARGADWEPLKGRKVCVWGDADEAGEKARKTVCSLLAALGCVVSYVDVASPEPLPKGWDAADAVAQGMGRKEIAAFVTARKRPWLEVVTSDPTAPVDPDPPAPVITNLKDVPKLELWNAAGLTLTMKGAPHHNDANMAKILEFADRVDGRIEVWWDTFLRRMLFRDKDGQVVEWPQEMNTVLAAWVQEQFGVPYMSHNTVERAVVAYAHKHPRNCVLEWFAGLTWDGTDRLATLLPLGFGAAPSPYHAAVGRCFMVGMVARALRPGCKVDTVPIFESPQGRGKSSALRVIGGEWFAEVHESILGKDFKLAIQGKLLIEISELNSFRRSEMNQIKGVITDQSDRFRVPFGRVSQDWPRQGVMAGTTNADDWNTDESGDARRFWPVGCGAIDLDWLAENRDQLFAEAIVRFKRGEQWHNVDGNEARALQQDRHTDDPWGEIIRQYCTGKDMVTAQQIMEFALELKIDKRDMMAARRVGGCLKSLGYSRITVRDGHRTYKAFRLPIMAPVEFQDF